MEGESQHDLEGERGAEDWKERAEPVMVMVASQETSLRAHVLCVFLQCLWSPGAKHFPGAELLSPAVRRGEQRGGRSLDITIIWELNKIPTPWTWQIAQIQIFRSVTQASVFFLCLIFVVVKYT